jgi:hypothetical protein
LKATPIPSNTGNECKAGHRTDFQRQQSGHHEGDQRHKHVGDATEHQQQQNRNCAEREKRCLQECTQHGIAIGVGLRLQYCAHRPSERFRMVNVASKQMDS